MQLLTVIIPAADKETENQWMKDNIDRASGEFSFCAPLTSNGNTVTHYWFSNQWSDEKAVALQAHFNCYKGSPAQALIEAGLQRYIPDLTI